MRFRQVHLDFHTSEIIPNIGAQFSTSNFQRELKRGHVNSITVFSKCHHGWAYHPSDANEIHPNLDFDLLGSQIAAAHEIDVKTPVYLSAGLDEKEARRHPEWLLRDANDRMNWADTFLKPGYHQFCMNTPYLDILVSQIEEVVQRYDVDGIFLDIVGVRTCLCHNCMATLTAEGLDPTDPKAVQDLGERVYKNYAHRTNEAVRKYRPDVSIFHNGGHITRGRRDLAHLNTQLELESLPTGGWGYDHFPLSARYAATLDMEYLGMTGKFHTSWGEFGGYKHPNALRYEAALSLAMGAKCSVGDQLHPSGLMDASTYSLIGAGYAEVESKEQWCEGSRNVADVALLSLEAVGQQQSPEGQMPAVGASDAGAVRMLLECHYLFDVIDPQADFSQYKVIVLPDAIRVDQGLKAKLTEFTSAGGRVLATGTSGLSATDNTFVLDLGATYDSPSDYNPSYFRPSFSTGAIDTAAFVMYGNSHKVDLAHNGTSLGMREEPYFNREWNHFCSHQHTPSDGVSAGPGMTEGPNGIYIAWTVFDDYATKGSIVLKKTVQHGLDQLLNDRKTLETNLGAQGIIALTRLPCGSKFVLHLLYASPVRRGNGVEVIEDLPVIHNVEVSLRGIAKVASVMLEPQHTSLNYQSVKDCILFTVPKLECHQMVVLTVQ